MDNILNSFKKKSDEGFNKNLLKNDGNNEKKEELLNVTIEEGNLLNIIKMNCNKDPNKNLLKNDNHNERKEELLNVTIEEDILYDFYKKKKSDENLNKNLLENNNLKITIEKENFFKKHYNKAHIKNLSENDDNNEKIEKFTIEEENYLYDYIKFNTKNLLENDDNIEKNYLYDYIKFNTKNLLENDDNNEKNYLKTTMEIFSQNTINILTNNDNYFYKFYLNKDIINSNSQKYNKLKDLFENIQSQIFKTNNSAIILNFISHKEIINNFDKFIKLSNEEKINHINKYINKYSNFYSFYDFLINNKVKKEKIFFSNNLNNISLSEMNNSKIFLDKLLVNKFNYKLTDKSTEKDINIIIFDFPILINEEIYLNSEELIEELKDDKLFITNYIELNDIEKQRFKDSSLFFIYNDNILHF